jgi:hypothetical protein
MRDETLLGTRRPGGADACPPEPDFLRRDSSVLETTEELLEPEGVAKVSSALPLDAPSDKWVTSSGSGFVVREGRDVVSTTASVELDGACWIPTWELSRDLCRAESRRSLTDIAASSDSPILDFERRLEGEGWKVCVSAEGDVTTDFGSGVAEEDLMGLGEADVLSLSRRDLAWASMVAKRNE